MKRLKLWEKVVLIGGAIVTLHLIYEGENTRIILPILGYILAGGIAIFAIDYWLNTKRPPEKRKNYKPLNQILAELFVLLIIVAVVGVAVFMVWGIFNHITHPEILDPDTMYNR